jgi:head-tail adaptor
MPRVVQAGPKRQILQLFDVPESTVDSFGQPSQAATLIGSFHAEVRMLQGNEMLNVRTMWPTATHLIRMRWVGSAIPVSADNPGQLILPNMKLTLTKNNVLIRVFNIVSAKNAEERNREWELTCEEKVGAQS